MKIPAIDTVLFFIPLIFAGTCNMIFVKSAVLDLLKVPMDRGLTLSNGKRLFGNNKTWKGFLGMIAFSSFWWAFFGLWLDLIYTRLNPLLYGALLGLGYVLMELPNSFFKRQIGIAPGKHASDKLLGTLFIIVDQMDSVIGCLVIVLIFDRMGLAEAVFFLIVGTIIHYLVHEILLLIKLKNYQKIESGNI